MAAGTTQNIISKLLRLHVSFSAQQAPLDSKCVVKFFFLKNLRKHKREHLICHSCVFDSILIKKELLSEAEVTRILKCYEHSLENWLISQLRQSKGKMSSEHLISQKVKDYSKHNGV